VEEYKSMNNARSKKTLPGKSTTWAYQITMDSKVTTKEVCPDSIKDQPDLIVVHQDSTKEGTLHKVQARGITQGINTTRSNKVSLPRISTKG